MTVVVPVLEHDFREHVRAAGCVTINLEVREVKGKKVHLFSLSTDLMNAEGRQAMLYSRTKPEPKIFNSLRSLQTILTRLGYHVVDIPVQEGSWTCTLPDKSGAQTRHSSLNKGMNSLPASLMPRTTVAMAQF